MGGLARQISKKIERFAGHACGGESGNHYRRARYGDHRDSMCMSSGHEEMAWIDHKGGSAIRDERDISALP
jgi:hypothetical protein